MIKNKAFTMSEALIVLGIVAVLAALSVVAINNSKPDENIALFRRAYSTTAKIVQDMMNDRELYPNADKPSEDSKLGSVANINGFLDNSITESMKEKYPYLTCSAGDSCEFGAKFVDIFMHKANALSSSTSSTSFSNLGGGTFSNSGTMTTPDGIYWNIRARRKVVRYGSITYTINIEIYTNGDDTDKSCSYDATTCPYPTKFVLNVSANDGTISTPDDPMACSYLRYPKAVRNSQIPIDGHVNTCFPVVEPEPSGGGGHSPTPH